MILSRVYFLTGNTRLIVGIQIFPKIEIKLYLENKNNIKIDFTYVDDKELGVTNFEHGLSMLGDTFNPPVSINRKYVGGNIGYKISQNEFHIFILEETMRLLQDIFPIAKVYADSLKGDKEKMEVFIQDLINETLKLEDSFLSARAAILGKASTPTEMEVVLLTKRLMKIIEEKKTKT